MKSTYGILSLAAASIVAISCNSTVPVSVGADEEIIPLKLVDEGAAPATQPALPPGHPPLSQDAPKQKPALPDGHPSLPGMTGGNNGAALPPGHPDLSAMKKKDVKPIDVVFTVNAVQSTKGAAPIGVAPATLEFFFDNQSAKKIEFQLNEKGSATVKADAIPSGAQPVLTVKHQTVDYHAVGTPVDAARPQSRIDVGVYETTEQVPAWTVKMQHVMLQPNADGVGVMEMIALENPTDRSWVGTLSEDGKRTTFKLPLPPGAKDVQLLQGFHDCCVEWVGNEIVNRMALTPGTGQYRLAYTIPYTDGHSTLAFKTPAPVEHLMVFLPDGAKASVKGLEDIGSQKMGDKSIHAFTGTKIPAGQEVQLIVDQPVGDAKAQSKAATSTIPAAMTGATKVNAGSADVVKIAKAIAIVGSVIVLLVAGMLMFVKPKKA